MNKEVIYLEPEDDITDILTKLQKASEQLVALVPPKKTTVLRSAVNMKLISRAAKESDKVVVVVTADPGITKLAMTAQIPIAKTLQSRPVVPTPEMLEETSSKEQVIDEDLAAAAENAENSQKTGQNSKNAAKNGSKTGSKASKKAQDAASEETAQEEPSANKTAEKASKKAQKGQKTGKNTVFFEKYRKLIIAGSVVGVALIGFLVWALIFAPAVQITIAMRTSPEVISETVSFTDKLDSENAKEGLFFAELQTKEEKYETTIKATGSEDRGEKAKGTLSLRLDVPMNATSGSREVKAGSTFVASNGLMYIATSSASATWSTNDCSGQTYTIDSGGFKLQYCAITVNVPIEAQASGDQYNLNANASWNSFDGMEVTNSNSINGGTSKIVKVLSQADVSTATENLINSHNEDNRTAFFEELVQKDKVIVDTSYKAETKSATSAPEVGKEAEEAKIQVVISYSVYTVDKAKVSEFVTEKLQLSDSQEMYSIGEPYFERFTSITETARLKTTAQVGPKVTKESVLEKAKGRKIGEVQSELRNIEGVSSVEIKPSYFWVWSVPGDPAKVTIDLIVEDHGDQEQ